MRIIKNCYQYNKELFIMEKFDLKCPSCGSSDVEASGHAPQPTYGWGCKCKQCGHPFGEVKNDDTPFSYDFSGES